MMKFGKLISVGVLVLTAAAACTVDSNPDESIADDAELLVIATRDFNNDGLTDLAIKTGKDGVYTDTILLNKGDLVFQWMHAASSRDNESPYGSDAWTDRGVHALTELTQSVDGLSATLDQLPRSSILDLGLQPTEDTARSFDQCPQHWFCMWQHKDYAGAFYGSPLNGCRMWNNNVGWFNDQASSWRNYSGCYVCVYEHENYNFTYNRTSTALSMVLPPSSSSSWVGLAWNDKITSWATRGSGVACF